MQVISHAANRLNGSHHCRHAKCFNSSRKLVSIQVSGGGQNTLRSVKLNFSHLGVHFSFMAFYLSHISFHFLIPVEDVSSGGSINY